MWPIVLFTRETSMSKTIAFLVCVFCVAVAFMACSKSSGQAEPVAATSTALSETGSGPYASATAAFYAGKYQECIDDVTNIMNASGETAEGLTLRGIALTKMGKTFSAYRDLLVATQKNYSPETLMNLGNALRMAGYCVRAADAYEQALKLRPGDPKLLVNVTSAYLCYGNIDAANESYSQLVGKLPSDAVALTVAGIVSSMAENYEQERIAAQKALEYDADYRPALKLLVHACSVVGDSECSKNAEKRYNFLSNRFNRKRKPIGEQL